MSGQTIPGVERPKQFFKGLDLRRSTLLRDGDSFTVADNVKFLKTGSLTSRPGYQGKEVTSGGLGLCTYERVSTTDNSSTVEEIIIGQKLYRLSNGTFVMTYSGSAVSVYCNIYVSSTTNTWQFELYEDEVLVYSLDLGLGFDEASTVTIGTLATAVNALADYAVVNTGSTTLPASFLPTIHTEPFSSNALTLSYKYQEEIFQPTSSTNPFASAWTNRNLSTHEMVSTVVLKNVLYLGSRYDDEKKYDGQKVYRSGLPQPTTPLVAVVANATGRTGTNIRYRVSFVQIDKQSNRHEGIISSESSTVSPAADFVDVAYTALGTTSGFNTDYAQVNGAQVGVTTITVDAAHTLKVGDVAYFWDSISGAHVERTVTAKTNTTITISGSAVTVIDNDPISANLRVAVYTQEVASGDYYLVGEYPHNSSTATPIIRDTGVTLGSQYIFPIPGTEAGLPPRGAYRAVYKNLKFISGVLDERDRVYYSDITSCESYPPDSNAFDVATPGQDKLSGLFTTNEYLAVFKNRSTHVVIGDFSEDGLFRFRVDDISLVVGCASHHSIAQIADGSIVFVSQKGIYKLLGTNLPEEIGYLITPALNAPSSDATRLVLNRSQALYDATEEAYYLFIPSEDTTGGNVHTTSSSKLFVLDLSLIPFGGPQRFSSWTNIDATCGLIKSGDDILFGERRYSTFGSAISYNLYKFLNSQTEYDYVDHSDSLPGVSMDCAPGWEDLGDPSTFKSPLRLKVFSADPDLASSFSLEVDTEINYIPSAVCLNTFVFGGSEASGGYSNEPYGVVYGASSEPEVDQKLGSIKAKAFRPRFRHSTRYAFPLITGWQYEVVAPYRMHIVE